MLINFFLKSFRILLFPFSIGYWVIIKIRNFLYDKNIFKSVKFALPVICVGNLAVGGTGKTPMVEYIIKLLVPTKQIATLSRGYRRKTKGFAIANENSTALEIGDEPMQFYTKFPQITVAVGEERIVAIPHILYDKPKTEVIILDDALQHRTVKAGLNILLTDYANLYIHDFYLPTGDLRDLKSSYKRAHVIVITKCPKDLREVKKEEIKADLKLLPHQKAFFTCLEYSPVQHLLNGHTAQIDELTEVLLVTGIANPSPLKNYLERKTKSYTLMQYNDHHIFTIDDLKEILKKYKEIKAEKKILLTTEKDAMRLTKFKDELNDFYIIPVEHRFLFNEATAFETIINNYTKSYSIQ